MISAAHDRVRDLYGSAIGRSKYELVTPALVLDRDVLLANLAFMEAQLPSLHARLRGHVKNHKSPHIARLQLEHGAFGLCAATIWEAIVMVRAGADDVLVANQLVDPRKRRAAALLAREANVTVNVDDVGDVEALSAAALEAGSTIGILVEVDTGMHRAGVDSPAEALAVARRVQELAGLRMEGISGYEGHCSLEMDHDKRHALQIEAMRYFVEVADLLEANGIPCPTLSAAGTATAFWTGANPRITELQLGSYATMDDYHFLMEPRFKKASAAVVTVISRRQGSAGPEPGQEDVRRGRRRQRSRPIPGSSATRRSSRTASTRSTRPTRRTRPARSRSATSSTSTSATRRSRSTTSTPTTSSRTRRWSTSGRSCRAARSTAACWPCSKAGNERPLSASPCPRASTSASS